jgi:trimeric autotransporter adhesin
VGVTRKGSYGDFTGEIYALALTDSGLYVGGGFDSAGGVAAKGVAVYDFDKGWQALGDSVSSTYTPYVYALAASPDGVYAGGEFTAAGTAQTSSLARWDGKRWQALGDGLSESASVKALAVFDGSVYVGGQFSSAGDAPASAFTRWGPPAAVEVVRPQIQGSNARATATPRANPRPGATATPTPCPTRTTTGGGVAGQGAPCGRPSRR